MNQPLISIVIPVYNGEKTITRAIDSCINQTYKNIEIIVVDDKSTDNTLQIISSISDPRIRLFKLNENSNGTKPRNKGIRESKGEYIAFLDDDDEYLPTRIEKLHEEISKRNDEYRVVSSSYYMQERNGWSIKRKKESEQTIQNLLLMKASVGGCSIMIHKSIIEDVGCFDESFRRHQDLEYTLRILRKTKMAIVDEPSIRIYGHPGAPNASKILEVKEHFLDVFREDILKLEPKVQREVYARHYLQVSRFFALDKDIVNTFKYLFKSLGYLIIKSDKYIFLPKETYFVIPIYLIKALIFGKRKWTK